MGDTPNKYQVNAKTKHSLYTIENQFLGLFFFVHEFNQSSWFLFSMNNLTFLPVSGRSYIIWVWQVPSTAHVEVQAPVTVVAEEPLSKAR